MSHNILLMTSAINVNKDMPFHHHIEKSFRLQQYIDALIFYITQSNLEYIIFCDWTNFDLDSNLWFIKELAYIYKKNIEFITFQQDKELLKTKWKGYGENKIIEYALENSQFSDKNKLFYKVTGRYIVKNINTIISNEISKENIFFKTSPLDNTNCNSAFFKCSVSFFQKKLLWSWNYVRDKEWYYLEHEYMTRLRWSNVNCFKQLPIFSWTAWWWWKLDLPRYVLIIKQFCNLLWLYKISWK